MPTTKRTARTARATPAARTRVAVVCGGSSAEAEVSRVSGRGVAAALRATFPDTTILECDAQIGSALIGSGAHVVFPVLHGSPGEDGTFQGFLEVLGLPYVGSGVRASACAMDKVVAKHIFRDAELLVARDAVVSRADDLLTMADRLLARLGDRLVVKPARQGSALGVSFAANRDELVAGLAMALRFDEQALVEARIVGKEVTVAVLERDDVEALPSIEIRTPENSWYDYEHRYTKGLSDHVIPAGITAAQEARISEVARRAHLALGCRDLSRADFVVPAAGDPVLLEVNTMPGMTPTSLYPDAAQAVGLSFEALVAHLVRRALSRAPRRRPAKASTGRRGARKKTQPKKGRRR
jgi:D-alanine-D-alanine ligase